MSTLLATQISKKPHGLIAAFPHVSARNFWSALFLPETWLFKKMSAQPSAVAATAAPGRPHGTRRNMNLCGTKKSRTHSTFTKVPQYSAGTRPARGKCRVSVNPKLVVVQ